jgi:hypothetical protein
MARLESAERYRSRNAVKFRATGARMSAPSSANLSEHVTEHPNKINAFLG